jgi:hypothetical protein
VPGVDDLDIRGDLSEVAERLLGPVPIDHGGSRGHDDPPRSRMECESKLERRLELHGTNRSGDSRRKRPVPDAPWFRGSHDDRRTRKQTGSILNREVHRWIRDGDDSGLGPEGGRDLLAEGVHALTEEARVEDDRLGDAVDGEVARNLPARGVGRLHPACSGS